MARQDNHVFLVDDDRCFGCGACIALCPVNVLTLVDRLAIVDEENCTPVSYTHLRAHET